MRVPTQESFAPLTLLTDIDTCVCMPAVTSLFDSLCLLSEGKAMYSGLASGAESFFVGCGFTVPQYTNPADFWLDISAFARDFACDISWRSPWNFFYSYFFY